jgi:hypothetical protein
MGKTSGKRMRRTVGFSLGPFMSILPEVTVRVHCEHSVESLLVKGQIRPHINAGSLTGFDDFEESLASSISRRETLHRFQSNSTPNILELLSKFEPKT